MFLLQSFSLSEILQLSFIIVCVILKHFTDHNLNHEITVAVIIYVLQHQITLISNHLLV